MTYTPVTPREARALLGEGIHTSLRKFADDPGAPDLWAAIHEHLPAWSQALEAALAGLDQMGFVLCHRGEEST